MPMQSGECLGESYLFVLGILHSPSMYVLDFQPFALSTEKMPFMACILGFFGFYLGPANERQHQVIREWRRENVGWIFTSPRPLAAFWQLATFFPSSSPLGL